MEPFYQEAEQPDFKPEPRILLPEVVSRIDGKRRQNSPLAVGLATALVIDEGWATEVPDPAFRQAA